MNEGADGALILYGCGKGAVPLPHCGSDGNRGLILFREVNDLIWTPEASTLFWALFPAVLSSFSCGFAGEKCRCFGGPILLVHFSGKVLDLNSLGRWRVFLGCRRCASRRADCRKSADPRPKISKKLTFVDLNS